MRAAGGCGGQPTVLAADLPIPYVITADEASVYWVDIGNGFMYGPDTAIRKCASQGCGQSPTSLFTGIQPEAIAVGAGKLFWTNGGSGQDSVWTSAVDGSSPQTLANVDGFAFHIAASSTTSTGSTAALALGVIVCGACFGLERAHVHLGFFLPLLQAAGGLMAVFGSCEAMILCVEGLGEHEAVILVLLGGVEAQASGEVLREVDGHPAPVVVGALSVHE